MMSKSGKKLVVTERPARRAARQAKVAELYLRGVSQRKIAGQLKLAKDTVMGDLEELRKEWLAMALVDFDEKRANEIAKIDHLEEQAWLAWGRSCEDAETRRHKKEKALRAGKKGQPAKMKVVGESQENTKKGQAGDVRFLERVAWCIDTRLRLIGAYKNNPTQINQLIVQWDEMYNRETRRDPVKEAIEATARGEEVYALPDRRAEQEARRAGKEETNNRAEVILEGRDNTPPSSTPRPVGARTLDEELDGEEE